MSDVVIRGVRADVLDAIDDRARRQGLCRTEYLRRLLERDALRPERPVTGADLDDFAEVFADLMDAEVMRGAWT